MGAQGECRAPPPTALAVLYSCPTSKLATCARACVWFLLLAGCYANQSIPPKLASPPLAFPAAFEAGTSASSGCASTVLLGRLPAAGSASFRACLQSLPSLALASSDSHQHSHRTAWRRLTHVLLLLLRSAQCSRLRASSQGATAWRALRRR